MAKDPAVLFYTQDFLTGTILMTDEQRGKYILLLCLQHQKGSLSEQDMLKICKAYDEIIWAKFIKDGDVYYNKRMREEAVKRSQYTESRRKNSRREKNISNSVKSASGHMLTHMANENENENGDQVIIEDANENEKMNRRLGKENKFDFVDKIIDEFVKAYGDYEIINIGKEREAAGKLLNLYKQKYPSSTSEETLVGLRDYFIECVNIQDPWYRNNMTLSLIINKYNEINSLLRDGEDKKLVANRAAYEALAVLAAKYFEKK